MLFLCLEFHDGSSSWVKTPILLVAYESLRVLCIPDPYLSGFILYFSLPTHSTGLCAGPRTDLSCLHWPFTLPGSLLVSEPLPSILGSNDRAKWDNPEYPA